MSEATLAAARLAVVTLRARPALTALVPALNIIDKNQRPEVFPCIIVGEAQAVADDADCIVGDEVFLTLHVWTEEDGLLAVKNIVGEMRRAFRDVEGLQDGFEVSLHWSDVVFLRDPDGLHSHAVVTVRALTEDTVGI